MVNDFLPVAIAGGSNVQSQVDYAASQEVATGFATGQSPPSPSFNKMVRQASSMAAALATFIGNVTGADVLDDGDIDALAALIAASVVSGSGGQCILSRASATSLKLSPRNGNLININGQLVQIPGAGVTIGNGTLTASTLYYVYAYLDDGVLTLELSATGHATDATTGVEIKAGDSTRSLVGMIYTSGDTPGQFVESGSQQFVANWFNRISKGTSNNVANTNTTSFGDIDVMPNNHAEFLSWGDGASVSLTGMVTNAAITSEISSFPALNGVRLGSVLFTPPSTANYYMNAAQTAVVVATTEGHNYVTVFGGSRYISGVTATSWSDLWIATTVNI